MTDKEKLDKMIAEIKRRAKHHAYRADIDRSPSEAGARDEDKEILSFFDSMQEKAKNEAKIKVEQIMAEVDAKFPKFAKEVKDMLEESVSDDLEKEVEKTKAMVKYLELNTDDIVDFCVSHYTNWQKQQMMKDAVEGKMIGDFSLSINCFSDVVDRMGLFEGDKVKLIILRDTTS